MTHPDVQAGSPLPAALAVQKAFFGPPMGAAGVAPPSGAVLVAPDAGSAANDATATPQNTLRNPLWIVVIGMACMFGVFAAVMALGWADARKRRARTGVSIDIVRKRADMARQ